MTTFKITNITNLLGKRSTNNNSILEVEYVDEMIKKTIKFKPQETIYLTSNSLPLSIHRLRIKGLVTVNEISKKELKEILAAKKAKETKIVKNMSKKREKIVDGGDSKKEIEEKIEIKPSKKSTKKSTKEDIENNNEKNEEIK